MQTEGVPIISTKKNTRQVIIHVDCKAIQISDYKASIHDKKRIWVVTKWALSLELSANHYKKNP